jgi:hypothetical protein
MSISSHLDLATDETGLAKKRKVTGDGSPQSPVNEQATLTLVDDRLVLAEPFVAPDAVWRDAMAQLASRMNIGIQPVQNRSIALRQRITWPWGVHAVPAAPVFAPWLSHACTAFQDPRGQREPSPARWVASYLWDPACSSRLVKGGVADVMLISPHPTACRTDEDSCASLPGIGLLQEMICAAQAEDRSRIVIVGYERSQNVTTRQLLSAKSRLPFAQLDLEVLAVEEALTRLASDPTSWDAIIVLPELRSLIFALLARLTGIGGTWPMVWHGKGLAFVCGEAVIPAAPNGPLDAALLIQTLALVACNGGKAPAARRLTEACARLRDRGLVTPTRGSPGPYCMQTCDAAMVEELCRPSDLTGRPVPTWKAMPSLRAGDSAAAMRPARLELVSDH